MLQRFLLLLFFASLFSCNETPSVPDISTLEEINVRLRRDPQRINPFYSPTTLGREVFQYIFMPLADYHPETLTLTPIIIEDIPTGYNYLNEKGQPRIAYDLKIKDDASWSDGADITGHDYLFTYNVIKHPASTCTAWKPYFENILDVKVDPQNNKKLTVYTNPDYMLTKEVTVTTCLMPRHIYDPEDVLSNYAVTDSVSTNIVSQVNESMNAKTDVVQSGPYRLTDYQTDEYIILERNPDYWGSAYPDNPFLQSNPEKIIFKMVGDPLATINMAKEGKLDVFTLQSSNNFLELKDDETFASEWNFFTPQLMFYYYIAMNNQSPLLSNKNMRRAMAHLLDVNEFIEVMDGGLGVRTTGHFHPTKSYYNNALAPIPYDLNKANTLLDREGWSMNSQSGYREKVVGGTKQELELDIIITGSKLSKNLAIILQEGAKKAGVKINIVTKNISVSRKENLYTYDYDMFALAQGLDSAPDDPYSKWHSDNIGPAKGNETAYNNPESDALIEKIRRSTTAEERKPYYLQLQEKMYDDQPCIFLYSPLIKILVNKKLAATATSKRPGYQVNTFRKKE